MKKQIFTLFIALTAIFASAQKTIGDVKVDAKLSIEGQNLTLNGAGTREKMFMDMYVGSLYVTKNLQMEMQFLQLMKLWQLN